MASRSRTHQINTKKHAVLGLLAGAGVLICAAGVNAQFDPSAIETFDSASADRVPFVETNWSLDAGCTPGLVGGDNPHGWGGQALIMQRAGTGTRMVMDLNPGAGSSTVGDMQWSGGAGITRLMFAADANTGENGMELYRAYEVVYPTTRLQLDINPGPSSSNPSEFARISVGDILFAADDGTNGVELWKSQTGGNLFTMQHVMLMDINPTGSSNPSGFSAAGTVFVFAADDGVNGRELWKTDGAIGGVHSILIDINQTPDNSASSDPQELTSVGSVPLTFFTAEDGVNGRELWRTDGTLAETGMVMNLDGAATSSNPTNLTSGSGLLGSSLFFTVDSDGAGGQELWKSDGALDGSDTIMVEDVGGSPSELTAAGDLVFFLLGNDLWKSDGTEPGTAVVQSFTSIQGPLASSGGSVYFAADDGGGSGTELWSSDGTTTSMVKDINPGGASDPQEIAAVAGRVYFSADDGTNGREPWRTDSTEGAVLVMDINQSAAGASSNPSQFSDFDGTVAFTADDGIHGAELWQTDGQPEPVILGVSHKWDLAAEIQAIDASKNAVAGTDGDVFLVGCNIVDSPTRGGGDNRLEARQAAHQLNNVVELTDGTDRAPIVITDVDCGDGSGWTRPRAALEGDGQPHNAIAAGLLPIMDQDPCDTSSFGPDSPAVPLMEVPVIYDGLNWIPMDREHFPDMLQSAEGFEINMLNQLTVTTLPEEMVPATIDPYTTKRFAGLKIFVRSDSFDVLFHKRQGGNDPAPGDTFWVVTVPRQYDGAFRALHVGTSSCTASAYEFYFDFLLLTGGVFTDTLVPFGSCCSSSGCADVNDETECTDGVFAPWRSCGEVTCCPAPWADADGDGDVDQLDFGQLQVCLDGGVTPECGCFDNTGDELIDSADFDAFVTCATGPAIVFDVNNPPAGCTVCAPPPAICPLP